VRDNLNRYAYFGTLKDDGLLSKWLATQSRLNERIAHPERTFRVFKQSIQFRQVGPRKDYVAGSSDTFPLRV
jgi:hypothetical protein